MDYSKILAKSFQKIEKYISKNKDDTVSTSIYLNPKELKAKLSLSLSKEGTDEDEFLNLLDDYLKFSVRTGKKQFLNQLYSGFNLPAFLGEVFSALTNTSMYTYEVAPVATLIEKEMINFLNTYANYKNGDGIFTTGGSNSNLLAMFSARNRIFPKSRFEGYNGKEHLVAFVNEYAHYSFDTAANLIGIGSNNVVKIKTNKNGNILIDEFEKAILKAVAEGKKPFFAVATCGTTLLGAFDPINEMAELCKKYGIWLHLDGAFGGSLILSKKNAPLFEGVEKTDSFSWNPHKLMNIPLICSVLLVKQRGTLQKNMSDINTDYIFHDKDEIEDLGKKSIQCGRRVDALKLWLALKYYGISGYEKRMNKLIEQAKYAESIVNEHKKLELMAERQSVAICFRYLPTNKNINLNDFNLKLRENLRKSGKTLVNYGYLNDTLLIRLVITNGEMKSSDVDTFFNYILKEGKKLELNFLQIKNY